MAFSSVSRFAKRLFSRMPATAGDTEDPALLYDPTSSNTADSDANANTGTYEEFFGGSLPCPTCRGSGRVPRESEHQLVALIPLSDKRLQPSRTVTYVIIAVVICAVIGALLLFFFYPRGIGLHSNMPAITPRLVVINASLPYLFMMIENRFNISNNNFVSVTAVNLAVSVEIDQREVACSVNTTALVVPMRATRLHYVTINITLSTHEQQYVITYCSRKSDYPHTILMPFRATLTTSFLGHLEQSSMTTYQWVKCSRTSSPPTLVTL